MPKKISRGPDEAAAESAAPTDSVSVIPTFTVIPREGGTVHLPAPDAPIPESDQEKDDAEK